MIDFKAKCLAALDQDEAYRSLAMKARDRGDREAYERLVELYVMIAEQLEALLECADDRPKDFR